MITEFIAASLIATTAFTVSPEVADPSKTIPLVREDITPWYTVTVDQTCPTSHPYVHEVGWGWGTSPHDNVIFWSIEYGDTPNQPATRIVGLMTNWNFETRWVEANLLCTSDVQKALRVPPRYP